MKPCLYLLANRQYAILWLGATISIWAQTIRMQLIPIDLRGRVFSLLRTLIQSTPPLGGILGS